MADTPTIRDGFTKIVESKFTADDVNDFARSYLTWQLDYLATPFLVTWLECERQDSIRAILQKAIADRTTPECLTT